MAPKRVLLVKVNMLIKFRMEFLEWAEILSEINFVLVSFIF